MGELAESDGGGRRRCRRWRKLALGLAVAGLFPFLAAAESLEFMGVAVDSMGGIFQVMRDVNVRAGPSTDTERVGQVATGTELEAVGRVQSGWIAVRRGGRDLGFVYEAYLQVVKPAPLERDGDGHLIDAEGKPLAPASGRFLVAAETTVRAKPSAKAARSGRLERGTRVEALGATADGKWLAVHWSGREMGFAVREALLPLIDGNLREPVKGTAPLPSGGTCAFAIRFTGKTAVEDDIIETADYDMDWQCAVAGRRLAFPGFMFITEAPFQLSDNQVYQISVDLLNVSREYDEIFSTVFLYRRAEAKVIFDGVSQRELAAEPASREAPAGSVREALAAAGRLAPTAWGTDVWTILSEETP